MVKNWVILVGDADNFDVFFGHNLVFTCQHIHYDTSNQRRDHILFS